MADITTYLNQIKSAIYGEDVRDAICNAIKQCYADAAGGTTVTLDTTLTKSGYAADAASVGEQLDMFTTKETTTTTTTTFNSAATATNLLTLVEIQQSLIVNSSGELETSENYYCTGNLDVTSIGYITFRANTSENSYDGVGFIAKYDSDKTFDYLDVIDSDGSVLTVSTVDADYVRFMIGMNANLDEFVITGGDSAAKSLANYNDFWSTEETVETTARRVSELADGCVTYNSLSAEVIAFIQALSES